MARILIIDDDELLRSVIRFVLEAAGYDVLDAAGGKAGLRLHRERGVDLVLVDIFMPDQDGFEVIRELRAELPQPKIVAMSGGGRSGQMDILEAAVGLGAAGTLRKPFEPRELLAMMRAVLGEH